MFLELIAAIFAGFAGAGLALVARLASGGRLPRWAIPVAAGAGMFGYAVWSEYTWHGRTVATLPAGVEVTLVNESRAPWRPWTYAVPLVDRFAALDTASLRRNADVPEQRIAEMHFFGRWAPHQRMAVVVDCARGLSAPLPGAAFEDGTGRVVAASWDAPRPGDRLLEVACG